MSAVLNRLPRFIWGKRQMSLTMVFTALFAVVCTLLSLPFSDNPWRKSVDPGKFIILTVAFLTVCAVFLMFSRALLVRIGSSKGMNALCYVLWCLAEIVIISLLYTWLTEGAVSRGEIRPVGAGTFELFYGAFLHGLTALGVPYALCGVYACMNDKSNTMRLTNYSNVVSDMPVRPYEQKRITLFDNSGALKFSIDSDNLYFIESDDNYIKVWYSDSSDQMRQYMLRCPLKTVEESFADSDLVRCHRKYIVNITKVRILKAEKEGYKISLDTDNPDTIPISKTYEQNVLARYNAR